MVGPSNPRPHPEVPERSGGLEGALQPVARSLEAFFEAAAPHLGPRPRMRVRTGSFTETGAHSSRWPRRGRVIP
ncbi:hypothetical protein CIW48_31460 [Methylobacterium sp. P1-11]|nr:hypothetical protein CIW48_31460 [Methylobacterium sp. P1-11]